MHTAIATLIGVSVSLLVNAIDAIGINILRRDHVLLEARPHGERRPFYRRPKWLLGMSLHSLVQAVGGPIQFLLLQPAVVAPLGSAALIFNAIFARCFVGSLITRLDIAGTLLMVMGGSLVAVFGNVEQKELTIGDMMLLFGRPVFIAYFSALGGVALIMFMISSRLKIKLDRRLAEHEYTSVSIADYDQAADDSDTGSQAHGTPLEASSQRKWVGAGFAATGASLASQSILIGDTVTKLVKTSLIQRAAENNQFTTIEPFCLLFVLVFLVLAQVYCTNAAVSRCDTVITAPVFFTVFSTLTLLNANIYYDQWNLYTPLMYGMFTTGITVLIIGIILISQSERRIGKSVVFVDDLGDDGMAGDEDGDEFDCKVSAETSDDMTSTRDGADASLLSSHSEGAPLSHGEDTLQ